MKKLPQPSPLEQRLSDALDARMEAIRKRFKLPQDKFILNGKRPEACGSLMKWARFMHEHDRHVGKTEEGNFFISTVFLGINHRWGGVGKPILFETMIFDRSTKKGKPLAYQRRYETWEQAERGHARAVAIMRRLYRMHGRVTNAALRRLLDA